MKIVIAILFLLTISCSGIQKAEKLKPYLSERPSPIFLEGNKTPIKISYIGCGGYLIQEKTSSIMIDPYFSNVAPLPLVPFKKLKPDTTLIDAFFKEKFDATRDQKGNLKAILVAHSHYDHLADIPAIYTRNCNPDSTLIIGGESTKNILEGAGIVDYVHAIDDSYSQAENGDYNWIYTANNRIRILPLASEHAPHICGIKLVSAKKVTQPLEAFPQKARKFPEGENYTFLIDFLDESGKVTFRIFSNASAACNGKEQVGFPPKELLEEKQVDVLFLCVASFNQVEGYPNELVKFIQPRHILLNHWENFFMPMSKLQKYPATVPGTNVSKFIAELENTADFTLLLPLTKIVFY